MKGRAMPPAASAATLNVQPQRRRAVYEALAKDTDGRSVKDLVADVEMSELDLRQSLRKLDDAGLARRVGRLWCAVPLETVDPPSSSSQQL
jgi:DeoR/GlpR family transcriptional regulator of sugar metabolism